MSDCISKRRPRLCVRTLPGFSPPATELDLNSAAVRGDREGDHKRREVKNTSGQQKRKKAENMLR